MLNKSLLLIVILYSQFCLANIKLVSESDNAVVLEVNAKYRLGDDDSKLDAKQLTTLEAKRMAADYSGTVLLSRTEMSDFEVTSDDVSVIASSYMRHEILNDNLSVEDGHVTYIQVSKVSIPKNQVNETLKSLLADDKGRKQLKEITRETVKQNEKIKQASSSSSANEVLTEVKSLQKGLQKQIELLASLKKDLTPNGAKEILASKGVSWTQKSFDQSVDNGDWEIILLFFEGEAKPFQFLKKSNKEQQLYKLVRNSKTEERDAFFKLLKGKDYSLLHQSVKWWPFAALADKDRELFLYFSAIYPDLIYADSTNKCDSA